MGGSALLCLRTPLREIAGRHSRETMMFHENSHPLTKNS